ncbi:DUF4384 domain-containing protein [Candidatus Venteria ishoeyi]|uniref:Putative peptidoglycan binding domain protein n=1 Tax=Candidatus Venteria ishoeyi TaxID=1899563 RepID=A0A1H6F6N8_9GAMM|nr:DUF4384 domain-containing protein [Candidatus Venteria ishoeyi]SEH04756.1 Putative peptidoglycan binding domain protein [Candidatus Venteria ishoeyi]
MWKISVVLLTLLVFVGGCSSTLPPKPDNNPYPKTEPTIPPARTLTNFSDSLRCMDRLFIRHGVEPIYITSAGLPDMSAKGVVGNGARHMLISTISKMAAQSKAVIFVDLPSSPMAYSDAPGTKNSDLDTLYKHLLYVMKETLKNHPHRRKFVYPDYYILGATSQVEDKVTSQGSSFSLALSSGDFSKSDDHATSIISLDMNVGDATNFQLLNGLTASNSIAVMRKSKNNEFGLGGILQKAGLHFNVALDQRQGPQQALRTLIELSSIELIGKLAQVPYWQCLQIEQTNPEMQAQARNWFNAMKPAEQVAFVQKTLHSKGFYHGSISGVLDGATKEAISRYQANEGLIPSGQVNFDLYRILMGGDFSKKPSKANTVPPVLTHTEPVKIQLKALKPSYKLNDRFSFYLSVSRDTFVHCYYQGGDKQIIRVFPNQRQADSYVKVNQKLEVPEQSALFEVILEHPHVQEQVMCLATEYDISLQLPGSLKVADIQPIALSSMEEVERAYKKMTANLGLASLVFAVK